MRYSFGILTCTMYFTSLPDHTKPGFDEQLHFSKFKKHNIIFNAQSSHAHCDDHIGCLSFKTVLRGEEWYGINHRRLAVSPGRFLILNDDQTYSCHIHKGEQVNVLSIFFKKEFASAVLHDALHNEENLLDDPFSRPGKILEFSQTLQGLESPLRLQLSSLIAALETSGGDADQTDEHLVFLLHDLIRSHQSEIARSKKVDAVKPATRAELYKRLCTARDVLHSSYMDKLDLNKISEVSCLSVPQLIRQFKAVFNTTPHRYLGAVRVRRAAELLEFTDKPVHEITWDCGFENVSAFCRAFKSAYGVQPLRLRKKGA
ncbi:helix-turn-helix domain-containing protein [Chryseolinea soli]|nr:AraC family transcriptional regulator [Chryseolinea soli]